LPNELDAIDAGQPFVCHRTSVTWSPSMRNITWMRIAGFERVASPSGASMTPAFRGCSKWSTTVAEYCSIPSIVADLRQAHALEHLDERVDVSRVEVGQYVPHPQVRLQANRSPQRLAFVRVPHAVGADHVAMEI